jgi:hypothetical protein
MKKAAFLILAVLMGFTVSAVYAQSGIFFGGETGLGIAFNGYDEQFDNFTDSFRISSGSGIRIVRVESLLAFPLAGYVGYGITDKFAVTGGLMLSLNQGIRWNGAEFSTNILDIPIMARYVFFNTPLVFGIQGGLYFGIPLGAKLSLSGYPGDMNNDGALFGGTGGLFIGYPLGPGRITGEVRFHKDFNAVKEKYIGNVFWRTNLFIMVGYEYALGSR